jgi:hypothetical protein
MAAAQQVGVNHEDGMNIGKSATSLLAFHGATPVDQSAAATSVSTSVPTQTSPFGFSTSAQVIALLAAVNAVIVCLKEKGLMAQ